MITLPPDSLESAPPIPGGGLLLAKNAGALMVGQMLGLVVPLLTIPYLARVLGPATWGPFVAVQGLGYWLLVVLEFAFDLSGTRAVARARTSREVMSEVVHGVQSAKVLLALSAIPIAAACLLFIPGIRQSTALVTWAVAFAILRGFSPLWFFQGIERVQGAVAVDSLTRAAAALGAFIVVHRPSDAWRVFALQAAFSALSLAILLTWLGRHVKLRLPGVRAGAAALREGSSLFACRAWAGLYVQGNALILSALAGPFIVGLFGGAERIIRAAINMLQPLTQVLMPRVTHLREMDPDGARKLVRQALVGVGLLGAAMGACALFGAPLLVHVILGSQYSGAIPVLRVMGGLPVIIALNTVLGLYWALPLGHDRLLLSSIIAGGVANVGFAVVLVPRYGALGMAGATLLAEGMAFVILASRYVRSELLVTAGGSAARRERQATRRRAERGVDRQTEPRRRQLY